MWKLSENTKGKGLIANRFISKGTILSKISFNNTSSLKTFQTVQCGINKHFLDSFHSLLNHSCNPNLVIEVTKGETYAIRDIQIGDELGFFYPSTEWIMDKPFKCECGSKNCIRIVEGAYSLPYNVISSLFINKHIRNLYYKNFRNISNRKKYIEKSYLLNTV
ncbi:MAG: SET domain-containing protein-lysine N-methyltransferase [Clostridiales bacterium]